MGKLGLWTTLWQGPQGLGDGLHAGLLLTAKYHVWRFSSPPTFPGPSCALKLREWTAYMLFFVSIIHFIGR